METSKKISGHQRLGVGRDEAAIGRIQRVFRAVKPLFMVLVMDTCHYTFVQIHIMYNAKNEP